MSDDLTRGEMIGAILIGSGYGLLAGILVICAIGAISTALKNLCELIKEARQ